MIRVDAGMPTSRFVQLIGIPERTWRRWQAKARQGYPPKGPWPAPIRSTYRDEVIKIAGDHPAWGHRKIWALARHQGLLLAPSSVLRILDGAGLLLKADYQRQRRELAKQRKAAFAVTPTGPNQVWQLDFSEYETTQGGTWRVGGVTDYYSKVEFGWHWSPTANQYDAIETVEMALAEAERLLGHPLPNDCPIDPETGLILPLITLVTDNAGPFRSFRFAAFIACHPELRHVRTRAKSPGQNGVRERGFGSLKYEWLYREPIDDILDLAREAEAYRIEYNTIRPHESLAWNRPLDVHQGLANPTTPNWEHPKTLPQT